MALLRISTSDRLEAAATIQANHPEVSFDAACMIVDYAFDFCMERATVAPPERDWGVRSVRYPVFGVEVPS